MMNPAYLLLAMGVIHKEIPEYNEAYLLKLYEDANDDNTTTNRWVKLAVDNIAARLQVEDVLTVNWITVKDQDYRKALNDLVSFNIHLENHQRLFGSVNEETTS